ncbi:hypothetical protein CCR97_21595 [Rhodoplanes elegans]|uniref:Uncharacterized protein n=1 Tax=Rhodoplanes elegans TaxID=29408 RepID=A0A327KM32_9BRAD|nr:hypothetical protein [Rhodoplanes elegans]MBK5960778.1 hypothetical protein [Rhodoplanes elegans]RAI38515.1 hypothetical protein CH338_12480 [Rhodoplanes elegans]
MPSPHTKALTAYRQRQSRKGVVRLELQVRQEDAALLRNIARALSDPSRENAARSLLNQEFGDRQNNALKALLASAPIDLDLTRDEDHGRDVEL